MFKVTITHCLVAIILSATFHMRQWSSSCFKQTWTYELTDVKFFSSNPDVIAGELAVVRIARGVFGINGFFDIKEDMDDTYIVEGTLHRSTNAGDDYRRIPFDITNETLSKAMNKYYKDLVMNTVQDCTTAAPLFEEFEAPLTKRYIKVEQCQISSEKMPSYMAEGLYKMTVMLHGVVEITIETYFAIENKGL